MELAVAVFRIATELSAPRTFEIARELRRSAMSVPSNIAEGFNRHSRAAYRLHVAIALGSVAELETQVELTTRLSHLSVSQSQSILESCSDVARLLQGLWRALKPSQGK